MRLFVEKKKGFDTEAVKLLSEIKKYLGITTVEDVKISAGYDVEGLEENSLKEAYYNVFADKISEEVLSQPSSGDAKFSYTISSLETQYDQRADACETLLKIIDPNSNPKVITFKHYAFYGSISEADFAKIKKYYINPLEVRSVTLEDDLSINFSEQVEPVVTIDGFIGMDETGLVKVKENYGVSMSMADLLFCQDYFRKEGKDPTITEIKILDTYWSDHCRHSTFMTVLENIQLEDGEYSKGLFSAVEKYNVAKNEVYPNGRPDCLMDIATLEMKKLKKKGILTDLEETDEINACSVEVKGIVDGKEEDFLIMFKNETHNHPTEIEPFGGAATCIGGGIRDPLSGRAYVYGAMRITGAADPREKFEDTLEGKLVQRRITTVAAEGYSSYANQIGLASTYLNEYYDGGFKAKRMECGALVGYNYKRNITRANPVAGDVIVLLGGKTGRDGIGGATGSSKQQGEVAAKHSSEVQKGNPLIERNIVRLFRKPEVSVMIKKCNDFGAGGVSVAIGELADSLLIDLNQVPVKYTGLNGTEIAISESQERMAVMIAAKDFDEFVKQAESENLSAVKAAVVTDSKRMVMTFNGQTICDMSSDFLASGGVRQKAEVQAQAPANIKENVSAGDVKAKLTEKLSDINVASKGSITNQFNKTVGGATSVYPFGGRYMKTPEQALAMRLPLEEGTTDLGTVMAVGYNPQLCRKSPFHGAVYAVTESVMKLVSMGADLSKIRLSFQEYFESMKSKESWGKVYSALMGAFLVEDELGIPGIGGKDSMSGTFKDINVPPSLISFAVAPMAISKVVTRAFKSVESNVYIVRTKINEDGTPDFDILKDNIKLIGSLIDSGKVLSASVVGTGGVASTVSQMCFGNKVGFKFTDSTTNVFDDNYTDVIIETKDALDLPVLGVTTQAEEIVLGGVTIYLTELQNAWESPLADTFEPNRDFTVPVKEVKEIKTIEVKKAIVGKTPKVLIPLFSGTNGEYTLERQFRRAGVDVEVLLFKTIDIANSYKALAKAISGCDMLAIPAGMSGGAEPDGAGKMISAILRESGVKDAVNALIARGGLVMGIGEGFKALVETGMIENGAVSEKTDTLTITRNKSDRFYSGLVSTKAVNNANPWTVGGETKTMPVAGIDGSVYMSEADFDKYSANGQIASIYVDEKGNVAADNTANPFGSYYAVEAMTSANGQVFGRMCDVSELEEGLYKNVLVAKTDETFKRIVDFFRN